MRRPFPPTIAPHWAAPLTPGIRAAVAELVASFYGQNCTIGQVLRRMQVPAAGVWARPGMVTGPILNTRVQPTTCATAGARGAGMAVSTRD